MKNKVSGNIWEWYKNGAYVIISIDAPKDNQKPLFTSSLSKQIRDNIPNCNLDGMLQQWSKFNKEMKYKGLPPVLIFHQYKIVLIPTKYINQSKVSMLENSLEQLKFVLYKHPELEFVIPYIGSNTGDLSIKDSRELLEMYLHDFNNIRTVDLSKQ